MDRRGPRRLRRQLGPARPDRGTPLDPAEHRRVESARALRAGGSRVYLYEFTHRVPARHFSEIPYVFGTVGSSAHNFADLELSEQILQLWGHFTARGIPALKTVWPPVEFHHEPFLRLELPSSVQADYREGRCALLADLQAVDMDRDGIGNTRDLCPLAPDPDQLDADADGVGDACDE